MRFCMSVKGYQLSPDINLPLPENLWTEIHIVKVCRWERNQARFETKKCIAIDIDTKDMYGDSSWGLSTIEHCHWLAEQWGENITYLWLFSQLILPTLMLFSTCLLDVGGDFCCTLYNFLNCKIILLLFCTSRHICQSHFEEILHWPACTVIQEFQEWFSWLEWFIRYITGIKREDVLYRKFLW